MKTKFAFAFFLVTLCAAGCKQSCEIEKNASTAAKSNAFTVSAGEEFVIPLYANPSTGYSWELAVPLDKNLLQLVSSEHSGGNPTLVGAGCTQEWKFKALKPGKAAIRLKYHRPWEKSVPPAKEQSFEITIR